MNHEKTLEKVEQRLKILPFYVREFINYRLTSSPHTLDNYTRDYIQFFQWIIDNNIHPGPMKDVDLYTLENLKVQDIVNFERYCLINKRNKLDTVARKLASLKSLFHYLSQIAEDEEMYPYLHRNVMAKIDIRKEKISERRRAEIISQQILVDDEFRIFRDFVRQGYGEYLMKYKKIRKHSAYKRNKERDLALVSLILGSGLRISEALSINMDEIDWQKKTALITRKGNSKDVATFSDTAAEDILHYLKVRDKKYKPDPSLKALFISGKTNNGKSQRLTVRSAQKMFKNYVIAFGRSRLTLHKLRHSFATQHYKENRDIALLKKILGHSNIETTMIYTHIFDVQIKDSINKADYF